MKPETVPPPEQPSLISDPKKFNQAIARFDAANSEDPNKESFDGAPHPKELLYARRMTAWLDKLEPDASEALRLAARCQHIRRWTIARSDYPDGRAGYLKWRATLAKFHAETAGKILRDVGYDADTIAHVQPLLKKENLKGDPDAQLLEDVICLVFLENYFADFAHKHDEQKLIEILRKTWKKMSPRAQKAALELNIPPAARRIVEKALRGK